MAPWRETGSALAATRNATVPSPCPLVPEVIWIHDAWVDAVHPHSRDTPIVNVPVPPSAEKLEEELVTDAWQRVVVGLVAVVTLVVAELPQAVVTRAVIRINSRTRP
jgi:hypothetical protein